MKIVDMICPHCNAPLKIDFNTKQAHCEHCGGTFLIDDGVKHVQYDNAEHAGYEFERGRLKAQEEAEYRRLKAQEEAEYRRMQVQNRAMQEQTQAMLAREQAIAKARRNNRLGKLITIVMVIIILFFLARGCLIKLGFIRSAADKKLTWADGVTDISKFDYIVDGDTLILTDYQGSDQRVKIAAEYVIDGSSKSVVELKSTFVLNSLKSVIVPEGVKKVEGNTFNSTGVEYLYLPSTLEDVPKSFWTYFHDVEKLYYGGTEAQWKKICPVERRDLEVKDIIYNADINSLVN